MPRKAPAAPIPGAKRPLSEMTVREALAIHWHYQHIDRSCGRGSQAVFDHASQLLKDAGRCAIETFLPPPPQCKDVKWE